MDYNPLELFEDDEPSSLERGRNAAMSALLGFAGSRLVSRPPLAEALRRLGNMSSESRIHIPAGDYRPAKEQYVSNWLTRRALFADDINRSPIIENAELRDLQNLMGTDVAVRAFKSDHSGPRLWKSFQGKDYDPRGYVAINPTYGIASGSPPAASKAVFLHELGHATRHLPSASIGRRAINHAIVPSRAMAVFSPVGMAFVDPNDKSEVATALGVRSLLEVPTLAEEFIASKKAFEGLDKLRDLGRMSGHAVDEGKDILRAAYKSYVGGAAGSVLGTALAIGLANDEIRSTLNPFD
jgi:Zn-dependent membrane protease YugP